MTADLLQFLHGRLDDDTRAATAAKPGMWHTDGNSVYATHPTDEVVDYTESAEHIARWNPARVLAEVDAKRQLLDRIVWYEELIDSEQGCCHYAEQIAAGQCEKVNPNEIEALRILALPYADHPNYRAEWAPEGWVGG